MPGDSPVCLLRDCAEPAVIHVRHADRGSCGECFCSWEHLLEYAHAAARDEAHPGTHPSSESPPSATGDHLLWAMVGTQRAEHFLG